jgi:hypothetical protein
LPRLRAARKEGRAAPSAEQEAQAAQQIRDGFASEQRTKNCTSPVLAFGFGLEITYSPKLREKLVVFRAGNPGGEAVVGAVYREIRPGEQHGPMRQGLLDRYGSDVVDNNPKTPTSPLFWLEDNVRRDLFIAKDTGSAPCAQFWPGDSIRIPGPYLTTDCGAFLRNDGGRLLMIDTRFNALRSVEAADRQPPGTPTPQLPF